MSKRVRRAPAVLDNTIQRHCIAVEGPEPVPWRGLLTITGICAACIDQNDPGILMIYYHEPPSRLVFRFGRTIAAAASVLQRIAEAVSLNGELIGTIGYAPARNDTMVTVMMFVRKHLLMFRTDDTDFDEYIICNGVQIRWTKGAGGSLEANGDDGRFKSLAKTCACYGPLPASKQRPGEASHHQ